MSADRALAVRSTTATTDVTRPFLRMDPRYLKTDLAGGVLFHGDMAFDGSYAPQVGPVTAGSAVKNIANDNVGAPRGVGDAGMVVANGQVVPFNGRGLDFGSLTAVGSYLQLPAAVSASIHASANQYFSVGLTIKLPTEGQWHASNTLPPWYTHSNVATGDTGAAGLISLGGRTVNTEKVISCYRQLTYNGTAGTIEPAMNLTLPPGSPAFGAVCRLAYRRTANGQRLTLFHPGGEISVTAAVGAKNTADFSATTPMVGVNGNRWTASVLAANAGKFRVYRLSIENLEISGRDPDAVATADWVRVQARGRFS